MENVAQSKGNHTKWTKIWCWLAEVVHSPSRYTNTHKKILNVLVAEIHMGGKKKALKPRVETTRRQNMSDWALSYATTLYQKTIRRDQKYWQWEDTEATQNYKYIMPRAWFQVTQRGKTKNHCKQHFNNSKAATASRKLRLKNVQGFMISVSNKEAAVFMYIVPPSLRMIT